MHHSSRVQPRCCMLCDLRNLHAVKLRSKRQFICYISIRTVLCTTIYAVQVEFNYKCTASYKARVRSSRACISKFPIHAPEAFGCTYLYTYLFKCVFYEVIILQKHCIERCIHDYKYLISYLYYAI